MDIVARPSPSGTIRRVLDALEPLTIRIDEQAVPPVPRGAEWAGLSLPLVRRVADRLAILGSGTLWQAPGCWRLEPAGLQVSFAHGRLLRCEPGAALRALLP